MQNLTVKVSCEFFNKLGSTKLSPIRIIPLEGYIYKHHFIVSSTIANEYILIGAVSSASLNELFGKVKISYDGDYEEIAEIL